MEQKSFTKPIKDLIRRRIELRKLIGKELSIEPATVYQYVYHNKDATLIKYPVVLEVIKDFTGLKESEIIEKPLKN